MLEAVSFTTALLPVNLTTGKPSESVTFAVTDGMVMPWYGLLASDTVAACAIVTVSLCVSESERAKTLIVCGVLQLPLLPPVNVSVAEEPKELVSFLTRTAVWSPDVAVTVTVAPGSEFRDTSYVCKGFVSMIESDEALTDTPAPVASIMKDAEILSESGKWSVPARRNRAVPTLTVTEGVPLTPEPE